MLIRTDDTDAFGQDELLRINFSVPDGQSVSKAILVCCDLQLTFETPTSPIRVHLNSEQSAILRDHTNCDLVLYDAQGKQLTIPCIAEIKSEEGADIK